MLDTLKVGIPLTQSQHKRIIQATAKLNRWQWVMMNQATGELQFRRVSGLASADQNSYHRELRFDIEQTYTPDCSLTVEFSVPKFWYGHNIHLLYDFTTALKHFKRLLEEQFGMQGRGRLPDPLTWRVMRADCCYAWRFPSQEMCHRFLESLKRLHFPRKVPVIYKDAIVFQGNTYTIKIYEKLPEFKKHDLKDMLKRQTPLEFVNHCEAIADGVLRFEATLRYRYLKRNGVRTVADLVESVEGIEWHQKGLPYYPNLAVLTFLEVQQSEGKTLEDGAVFSMPSGQIGIDHKDLSNIYRFPGSDFTYFKRDKVIALLQDFLTKFVGDNTGMQAVDQVKAKLLETYKPVKAARLMSFWLYVQRFGSLEAKEIFGKDSYYYNSRQIKKAGVSLIEPPSGNKVTVIDKEFLERFKLEVPSPYATNTVDDFRDSTNVLNFTPRMSGMQYKA